MPSNDLDRWNNRYREAPETAGVEPVPLLVEALQHVAPGRALDLACGAGRNALWLARQGWKVTAVDGSREAIELVNHRAAQAALPVTTQLADLEAGEYPLQPEAWELILISYYLQRDLYEKAKPGVSPGGLLIAIAHLAEPGRESRFSTQPGELAAFFPDWEILHSKEGQPTGATATGSRHVAEIVARRPNGGRPA